jgi:hypothetical protein
MKTFLCILMLAAMSAGTALAQRPSNFGAGVVFGDPTGFAWKYYLSQDRALSGTFGVSPDDRFRLDMSYLWHAHPFQERQMGIHYGLGGVIGFGRSGYFITRRGDVSYFTDREVGFGIRGVVGIDYNIPRSPLDIFLEVAPVFVITPVGGSGVDAGLGMRVYF